MDVPTEHTFRIFLWMCHASKHTLSLNNYIDMLLVGIVDHRTNHHETYFRR